LAFNLDFTVEPLKKKCRGLEERVKPSSAKEAIMSQTTAKTVKNGPEIKAYWVEKKELKESF